jgi:hypothetical protein
LVVTISTSSVDPEGDPISYSYEWMKNGVTSTASTSATLGSSETTKSDIWSVTVTPNDGVGDGASATDSVTIVNLDPVITSVSITPSTGVTTSTTLS